MYNFLLKKHVYKFMMQLDDMHSTPGCIDPTFSLSHALPHHATIQLRLAPNDDDHLSSNCIQLWCQTSGGPLRLGKQRLKH